MTLLMGILRALLPLTATLILTIPAASPAAAASAFDERDPLLVEASSDPAEWSVGQAGQLTLKLRLPPKYHAYEDKFAVQIMEPDAFLMGPIKVEGVKEFYDKFSKKNRRGVEERSTITVPLEAPGEWVGNVEDRIVLQLTYQACSDTFCLFPITKTVKIPAKMIGAEAARAAARKSAPSAVVADSPTSDWLSIEKLNSLLGDNKFLALFFVFLAGILTSFTPCIFPMIPITLAVLGHGAEKRSRAQNFALSLCYVHGIATTYSILGVIAASGGAVFGASLGNPWVLGAVCVLFFVMALSMYGLFELQVPAVLRQTLGTKKTTPGYFGAYLSGLIAGVVASPCVGPVLVAILAWVATTGSKLYGFVLLFTYAMGLGLIFLFLGVFTGLTRRLPRSGPWLETVKFVLGSLMLGAFYYYLGLLIPNRWHDGALGVGLVTLGSLAGAFLPLRGTSALQKIRKGFAQALLALGIGYLALAVFDLRPVMDRRVMDANVVQADGFRWQPYSEQALQAAQAAGRPVVIDFWAEWCAACHELADRTFTDRRVKALAQGFVALKYDATSDSPELRELKKRWKIQGLPTVLFVNPQGVWLESLTLTEFETADRFSARLEKAMN